MLKTTLVIVMSTCTCHISALTLAAVLLHFYLSTEGKYFEVSPTDFGEGGQKNPEGELKGHLDARLVHGEDGKGSLLLFWKGLWSILSWSNIGCAQCSLSLLGFTLHCRPAEQQQKSSQQPCPWPTHPQHTCFHHHFLTGSLRYFYTAGPCR